MRENVLREQRWCIVWTRLFRLPNHRLLLVCVQGIVVEKLPPLATSQRGLTARFLDLEIQGTVTKASLVKLVGHTRAAAVVCVTSERAQRSYPA